jgi:hypothetical protein
MSKLSDDNSIRVPRVPGRNSGRLLLGWLVALLLLAALTAQVAVILPPPAATRDGRGTLAPAAPPETVHAVLGGFPSFQAGGRLSARHARQTGGASPLLPAAACLSTLPSGATLRVTAPPPAPTPIRVRPAAPRAPPSCC